MVNANNVRMSAGRELQRCKAMDRGASDGASRLAAQANSCEMPACVGIRHYIISDSGRLRFANNVGRGGWEGCWQDYMNKQHD
jgi:hypothetical protein